MFWATGVCQSFPKTITNPSNPANHVGQHHEHEHPPLNDIATSTSRYPEHGGVPRNFRPKQRNPDLDPRVTSSLLCDLSIVADVSAAMNDCEEGDCVRDK